MTGGVLVAMLFVVVLFSGKTVLPIALLIVILAAAVWGVVERRRRTQPGAEQPVNGSVTLSDGDSVSPSS